MDERLPDWFENRDDAELEEDERRTPGGRVWIAIVTLLIVIGLAVVPTLDLVHLGRGSSRPAPRLTPTQQVAWSFGLAVLELRSVEDAMRFVAPGQRPAIETIVADLRALDPASLSGTLVGFGAVRCADPAPASAECFVAWLYQSGGAEVARIGYVVAGGPDAPLVIHAERLVPPIAAR